VNCVTGKLVYRTQAEAHAMRLRLAARGRVLDVVRCGVCNMWHLGSANRRRGTEKMKDHAPPKKKKQRRGGKGKRWPSRSEGEGGL
jgi:hypothetical protein